MAFSKRVLFFIAGSLALLAMLLAATLQLLRPDLLWVVTAGPFGSRRSAIVWLYAIGIGLSLALLLRAKRPLNRKRRVLAAVTLAAVTLLAIHAVNFFRHYSITTVTYNSSDGTPLEASLYLPKSEAPHPAVVIVHGSAPIRRGAYEVVAEPLVKRGYAVLLADKRGVGGSGGVFDTQDNTGPANIARLTSDVVAGVRYLKAHSKIRGERIGLLGFSQAGWVGPLAALADTSIRFMVMVTAPTVSTREENVWSRLRGDHSGDASASMRDAEQITDTVSSNGIDARVSLGSLRIPALYLFGTEDNSVPSRKSIRVLDSLNGAGGRYSYRLYDGYGHGVAGRNGSLVPRMAPAARPDILRWLEETFPD